MPDPVPLQDNVCRRGVTGVQRLTSGDPGRSLRSPRLPVQVVGRGRQDRQGGRAAVLLLLFFPFNAI